MKTIIEKEELRRLYIDENKTDEQIGQIYSLSTFCVWQLRKQYGIKGINPKHRKFFDNPQIPITSRQMSIIMGSLLGDCCIKQHDITAYLSISHSIKQKDYLDWLYKELRSICPVPPKSYISKGKYTTYYFISESRQDLKELKDKIYIPTKKVTQWFLDQIDELALAVWYMDDGCLSYINKSKTKCSFATNAFSIEENYLLAAFFKNRFNLNAEVVPYNKKSGIQYNLFISDDSFNAFIDIVSPYILDSLKYKLPCDINKQHWATNIENKINKEVLEKLYYEDLLTQEQIAQVLNVHKVTVQKYMNIFNLKPRNIVEAQIGGKNNRCLRTQDGKFLPAFLSEEQEKIAQNLFIELRKQEFPYVPVKDDIHYISAIDRLWNNSNSKKLNENTFEYSRAAIEICSAYCPQVYSMSANNSFSPLEIFNNDDMLLDCIRRVIKYGKKYSVAAIRQGLKTYRRNRCVTMFSPAWAKIIINTLYPKESNLSVCDFSCGFGGRLIGSYASQSVSEYIGIDPLYKNIQSHNDINRLIQKHASFMNVFFKTEFVNDMAENILPILNKTFDIILTSPPYFNKEKYSNDDSQCYIKHANYYEWKQKWLRFVLEESYKKLNDKGSLIIFASNCDEYMVGFDCRDIMREISKMEPICYNFAVPSLEYFRSKGFKKCDTAWVVQKI